MAEPESRTATEWNVPCLAFVTSVPSAEPSTGSATTTSGLCARSGRYPC